jgi:RNA polymerase sigma-70 factor (ECF subfamily)
MPNQRAAAGGDEPTGRFEQLFREHHAAVVAYVRRRAPEEAVDDAVEETFLVAWRRLDRVPAAELPWLLGVARNVLATQRRGALRRQSLSWRVAATEPNRSGVVDAESGVAGLDPRLAHALDELPEKDREALTLIAWDGLEPQEAAVVVGASAGAFRVRLHRARRRLRRALEERSEDPAGVQSRLRVEGVARD